MLRVSTSMMYERSINSMLQKQGELALTQLHISTGKKILSPSDDPAASARIMDLNSTISRVEQYQKNASRAQSSLEIEEAALASVNTLLIRATELSIKGNNDVYSDDQKASMGSEVRHLLSELEALANTRGSNGEYIFAGYKAHEQPFENLGGGQYAYRGDAGNRELQIAPGRFITDGDNGLDVFMNIETSTGGGRNAFETLDQLATALETNVSTGVYIDDVKLVTNRMLEHRASVGGRLNSIDEQVDVNGHFLLTMETSRAEDTDLDYAKAISQFERELVALQAAQKSYVKIQGLSLFNYL